jgi:N-acetylneuraminate synthase
MTNIFIGDRPVGEDCDPFIIAEMSGNHNQSLDQAIKMVDAAADTGADALKLQTYTADTMTLDSTGPGFVIEDPDSLWHGRSLYQLYQEAHTPWEWHEQIFRRCTERGLICFSTPFDDSAVAFLEELEVPCYKIASFENTCIPLIERVAATGKPLLLSTGMASEEELDASVAAARAAGCEQLILLKCTSSYPASPKQANLKTIADMRRRYDCQVGLSDHTLGTAVATTSIALGATVVEKHFTLSRAEGGVDADFSLEPAEFRELVDSCRIASQALGSVSYGTTDREKNSLNFRRSLYIVRDVAVGAELCEEDIRAIRPGFGLAPAAWKEVLGRKTTRELKRGEPLSWDMLE